jgi:formylmethanofuran dehydrogenase subunit B
MAEIGDKEVKSLGLCRLGHVHLESKAHLSGVEAILREGNKEVKLSLDKALKKAVEMLISAQHPLLYGWSRCTNETINEGLSLASTLKATFDSNATMGLSQVMNHHVHNMELGTDLEVVQNKGEFILYWGSNPVESSHRHASRFTIFPRGDSVPQGVESRVVGVIDVRETETMKMANHRIIIPQGTDDEFARALISDLTGKAPLKKSILGLPATTLVGLSQALRKSDFTIIFYGTGIMNSGKVKENLTALAELIQTLRDLGKQAYVMPMWHEPNDMGMIRSSNELVATRVDVDYISEKPSLIGDTTILQRLAKGEFDVALIVGSDALASLPSRAAKGLASAKTIYMGPTGGLTDHRALLSLRVTDDIISASGTMTRVDMKDIQLKEWGAGKHSTQNLFDLISQLHQLIRGKLKE